MPGRQTERFLTTVLFTDIVGSTEVAAELGDRAWRELVQEHHRLIRASLDRHGGRELDTAGDGFFAIFTAPAAAAECALDAIEAVQALGIQIRAGIHVGEVEQSGKKVTGITVPTGARIMAAAEGGELLVSTTVRDLAAGSGLRFEDRGERQLKGVPGTWRIYAVTRPGDHAPAMAGDGVARRAAAVRRVESRPYWQRHPRQSAVVAVALTAVIVATGALIWSPWRPKALAGVAENSVGIIDPARNEIVAAIKVDAQPAAIAFGEGAVWVTNTESDTVSRIDPETRAVVQTISVGRSPAGIAVGGGSVWVANSGGRSVSRINVATNKVVDEIDVGNSPTAIGFAAEPGSPAGAGSGRGVVWVSNTGDGTLTRIDTATDRASAPISIGSQPLALALSVDALWVANQDGATVSRLDPGTGASLSPAIPVGWRPSAIAIGSGSVWVANSGSGSISRIDPGTGSVIGVVNVGGTPTALALDGTTLWVADANSGVLRVEENSGACCVRIATTSAPQAITIVNHEVWFASRASAASHRGGTIRIVAHDSPPPLDPQGFGLNELESLMGDGLVGYPRVGGIIGSQLVPDLATAVPKPTDGGLIYTFRLRPGLRYSDGSPVHPSDFKTSLERAFLALEAPELSDSVGGQFYEAITGAAACLPPNKPRRCDLTAGIVPDDAANTVVFHLSHPDPDFLYKLSLTFAYAIKPGSLPDVRATQPFLGTGPYRMASVKGNVVTLTRNPFFKSPDPQVRPDGFADELTFTYGVDPEDQVKMVAAGTADYMAEQIPADAFHLLETSYTPQLHLAAQTTTTLFFNVKLAPFDNLKVRQAISFALDRSAIAELRGGTQVVSVTCQVLPPNFPGYQPYCPFTKDPAPQGRGRWTAPDLARARALVASSGAAKAKITVGPFAPRLNPLVKPIAAMLRGIGFSNVSEKAVSDSNELFPLIGAGKVQMGAFEFIQDFPGPDTFLAGFTCNENDGLVNNCNPPLDALVQQARDLQATDASAAADKWAEADRMVVDQALWVPMVNEGSDFVSARLRNYQFNLTYGILLDQAWVK